MREGSLRLNLNTRQIFKYLKRKKKAVWGGGASYSASKSIYLTVTAMEMLGAISFILPTQ